MFKKYPRVLYFISGTVPSSEQVREAQKFGPNTSFRNATLVSSEGALEAADGVAGDVPTRYADYTSAEDAIAAYEAKLAQLEFDFEGEGEGEGGRDSKAPATPAQAPAPKAPAPAATPKPATKAAWAHNAPVSGDK